MDFIKTALAAAVLFALAGCATYPYQSAFDACDAEAGACYRYCEEAGLGVGEYAACHADCETGANRCFANAYDRYSYGAASGAYYSPSWPWYGRYGAWGPSRGYYFDFSYWGGSGRYYDPYYDNRHRHGRRPRHGDRNRDGYRDRDRNRDRDRGRGDRPRGGVVDPPPGSPAADNPRRPRPAPGGQPRGRTPTTQPPQSSPPPSSSPPTAAPRQQPRSTPRNQRQQRNERRRKPEDF
ncbi:hypothetical protein [Hyphococcus sp.]|uniref:hypothetical protein n=1 Tax=Hyphococcus sp. TaxID=2038636 RepID=UPI0035C71F86